MRAIVIESPGGADSLVERELPDPVPGPGEALISVAAAGVNRADVSQREGRYPPPPGAPDWPGLEVSGTIVALGSESDAWAVGDEVCALLPGGGYAGLAIGRTGQLLRVPSRIALQDAAALPEAVATVWSNLVLIGGMRAGDTVLVHGGSSGIGTTAIQLATAMGCRVAVTASSSVKLAACRSLGADILIDYSREDFVAALLDQTNGRGADLILDAIGGAYVERNLAALARHGRLIVIGNQSGEDASFPIGALLGRWASIHGSTLRSRPEHEKDEIIASVAENVWPLVDAGHLRPVVDDRFALADAASAHRRMESSAHIGKLLLIP